MGMFTLVLLILSAYYLWECGACHKSKSRFTDLNCVSYNESFVRFNKCKLNVIGRGVVAANLYIELLQKPVHDVIINWSIWRRYNGYYPFLYNVTSDLCQLLAHPKLLSFEGLVLSAISTRSNVNHTCPFNHDIIVDNLVFLDGFLKTLPLPQGKYKLQLRFGTYKVWTMQIEISLFRDE